MTAEAVSSNENQSWLDRTLKRNLRIDLEVALYILLLCVAVFSRFYDLDTRVMSHDESLHTQFSWYLSEGRGFSHDPLMHGTFQMHVVSLSYFLFGVSDASARIPAAFFGVIAVGLVLLFRKWLGRWGTLAATAMMVFSPYMLYYDRYVRNEALVVPMALLMYYAVFRYFEGREAKWLYLLAASLALHFTTKETSFIYTAQLLAFLGGFFALRLLRFTWKQYSHKIGFVVGLITTALGGTLAMGTLFGGWAASGDIANALEPTIEGTVSTGVGAASSSPLVAAGLLLAILGLILMVVTLVLAFGKRLRTDFPELDLLVIAGTVTLPQLAALPANLLGWDPLDYSSFSNLNQTIAIVVILFLISAAIGALWDWRRWLVAAGVFFGIFVVFYTTLFTNDDGLASGLVGSLGYWLEQHGVERGGQPWYYYLFVQIPIYEYLPAVCSIMAFVYWLRLRPDDQAPAPDSKFEVSFPIIGFLGFMTITSLIGYSFAGEKMPWLTVHIALPMILFGGWGIGQFLERFNWPNFKEQRSWLILLLILLMLLALASAMGRILGETPPFQGSELDQLRTTSGFIVAIAFAIGAAIAIRRLSEGIPFRIITSIASVFLLGVLFILTIRTGFRAAFVNYDDATEYLVYAHSASGVKTVMDQVEDLSIRTTDGLGIQIAYDDDVSWPLNWYLRDYTNQYFYGANPTRELLNYPLVLVGDNNWHLVEPLLADRFYSYEYIRMWWPNQDYWNLKWSAIDADRSRDLMPDSEPLLPMGTMEYLSLVWGRLKPFFTESALRSAVWKIWLDRDFTEYGAWKGQDMSLARWTPSDRMRLYIRKDIAAQVWDYGVTPASFTPPTIEDPYADSIIELGADLVIGGEGLSPGEFFHPRDMAIGPDGTIYVADTLNHRIQRFSSEGQILTTWGGFGESQAGGAEDGTFNEPWGIDVAPNGNVYVADTWNHRIQWFSPTGAYLGSFGQEGLGDEPFSFWGPRDVAVDRQGRVYVADTGNKRIKVFDSEGNFVTQFGGPGYLPGLLDEPVGISIGADDRVYIADTWNQRIQVFSEISPQSFDAVQEWNIDAWYGQSLDNKPFLDAGPGNAICTTDPEGFRVLCFTFEGDFLLGWGGEFGEADYQFSLISGIALGPDGKVWVVDSSNHRVMRFAPAFP
jgi:predicted membrane-bound mannosyltransferase